MTSTIVNTHQNLSLGKHSVNVTTRCGQTMGVVTLTKLTVATVRLWALVVKTVEAGERKCEKIAPTFEELVGLDSREPFATVWGKLTVGDSEITITAHAHATAQDVLDTAWANIDACNQIRASLKDAAAKAAPVVPTLIPVPDETRRIPQPDNVVGTSNQKPVEQAPVAATPADVGLVRHVGTLKKGVEVIDGELVSFDIAKVELEEVNGLKKWKVYNLFGSKPGQFPAGSLTIYGDNELAMKAVGDALAELSLKPGIPAEGRWRGVYRVRVSGDKTSYYPVQFGKAS